MVGEQLFILKSAIKQKKSNFFDQKKDQTKLLSDGFLKLHLTENKIYWLKTRLIPGHLIKRLRIFLETGFI